MSDAIEAGVPAETGTAAPAVPAAPLTAAATLTGDPAAPATPETAAPTLPEGAVQMPGKEATAEDWAAFYGKIGRPDAPEGYELPIPEGDDGAFAQAMAPVLHKHGITAEQAKGLAADWNQMRADSLEQIAAADAAAAAAQNTKNLAEAESLKNEWGQSFDTNMHDAKQAVTQFFPKEQAGEIIAAIESRVGYRATIQMLHAIGKGMAEHDAAGLTGEAKGGEKTLAQRMYPGMAA